MSFLCAHCGDSIEKKNSCPRESCSEASARIPTAEPDSRGVPRVKRGRDWQTEPRRARKAHNVRMLPSAFERIQRSASRERMTVADLLERWALTLPSE